MMINVQFNNTEAEFFLKTNYIQYPLFYTLLLPALAYLGTQCTRITAENNLPEPQQLWLFIINILVQVSSFIYTMKGIIGFSWFTGSMTAIFSFSSVVSVTLNTVTIFIIGVAVAQLEMELEKIGNLQDCKTGEQHCSSGLKQMSALKKGLAPLLFLVFSNNGLLTIMVCLSARLQSCKQNTIVTSPKNTPLNSYITQISTLVPATLMLIYICLVLDNGYQTFRSLPLEFRLALSVSYYIFISI